MSPIAYAIAATVVWTANLLLLGKVMQIWPVGLGGSLSRLITVAVLGVWIILSKGSGWRRLRWHGQGGWLLLMGAVAIGINMCWYIGMKWTTPTNAALLFRMDLLFVLIIGMILGIERISWQGLAVMPFMLGGMALVMQVSQVDLGGHLRGDILIVLAALTFAINAFIIRRILKHMDTQAVALYNYLLSALGFVVLAMAQGVEPSTNPLPHMAAWFWLVILSLCGAVSLPLYYAALHRMPVWKLRVFMLLSPLLAAVADWLIWGHRLHGSQWLGACLLLGGASVLIYTEARAAKKKTQQITVDADLAVMETTAT